MDKLANGQVTPKTDFTNSELLLNHLKYRARTYRTTFGMDELDIALNLLQENELNDPNVRIDATLVNGLAAGASLLPRKNISVSGKKTIALNFTEMTERLKERPQYVIEGFLPESSVSLLAGDSGIGKSPFLVQMGLSVASGTPFLDMPTTQGGVVLVDYENQLHTTHGFISSIAAYLNLSSIPNSFHSIRGGDVNGPDDVMRQLLILRPKLVMIDAIRGFDSSLEDKNAESGKRLTELLHFAEAESMSIVLLHHLRKSNDEYPPEALESAPIMEWMQQVSGPRALVNQTATRIAIERYTGKSSELVLKGHFKGAGEFGPWYIAREYDEGGYPIGYKRVKGLNLLSAEHAAKFRLLPDLFHFKTVQLTLQKSASSTASFIKRLLDADLIIKIGDGKNTHYTKKV